MSYPILKRDPDFAPISGSMSSDCAPVFHLSPAVTTRATSKAYCQWYELLCDSSETLGQQGDECWDRCCQDGRQDCNLLPLFVTLFCWLPYQMIWTINVLKYLTHARPRDMARSRPPFWIFSFAAWKWVNMDGNWRNFDGNISSYV